MTLSLISVNHHLFTGPRRQGLRGLTREGSFTAGSGGDGQGLRWKGCRGGKVRREMARHPSVLQSSDHHSDGPQEGSWLTFRIPKHHPHTAQVEKQIMAGEPERNSEKHPEMEHFSRQPAQCSRQRALLAGFIQNQSVGLFLSPLYAKGSSSFTVSAT